MALRTFDFSSSQRRNRDNAQSALQAEMTGRRVSRTICYNRAHRELTEQNCASTQFLSAPKTRDSGPAAR